MDEYSWTEFVSSLKTRSLEDLKRICEDYENYTDDQAHAAEDEIARRS
jgi:hypothetical protein